jgi:hypothetical protein
MEREINFFLQEFEYKRGDTDIKALQQLQDAMKDSTNKFSYARQIVDANADTLINKGNQNFFKKT